MQFIIYLISKPLFTTGLRAAYNVIKKFKINYHSMFNNKSNKNRQHKQIPEGGRKRERRKGARGKGGKFSQMEEF